MCVSALLAIAACGESGVSENTPAATGQVATATAPADNNGDTATPTPTPITLADAMGELTTPTPTPTPELMITPRGDEGSEPISALEAEMRARCLHLVRDTEDAMTYSEFRELDPDNMSDLERVLWREVDESYFCLDYWSESLSLENADKRNESFRFACYWDLTSQREYRREGSNGGVVDQYARIANWIDMPGRDLLALETRPIDYVVAEYERQRQGHRTTNEDEWYKILEAWPRYNEFELRNYGNGDADSCVYFYPQMFTGRWIPIDTPLTLNHPNSTPTPAATAEAIRETWEERDWPLYWSN